MDPQIRTLIEELESLRQSRNDHWQVPRVEGDLLYQIALATRARLIVEAGTSYGFSGLHWAAALRQNGGGRLHTIDLSERKVASSRETFQRAGVVDLIENHHGDAAEVLARMPEGIDIAFLDAGDKTLTQTYFEIVWPKVRVGGSVLTDNAVTHREPLASFVRHVRSRGDAASTELPVGNGLEWTVKLR